MKTVEKTGTITGETALTEAYEAARRILGKPLSETELCEFEKGKKEPMLCPILTAGHLANPSAPVGFAPCIGERCMFCMPEFSGGSDVFCTLMADMCAQDDHDLLVEILHALEEHGHKLD